LRFHCGLEFVGLPAEQREMVRYWVFRAAPQPMDFRAFKKEAKVPVAKIEAPAAVTAANRGRRIRIGRRGFYLLLACTLALAGLAWWQWQRSWNELEARAAAAEPGLRVSPETVSAETMAQRILTKVDPVYPEAARAARTQGLVVLDAVIAPDGSVKRLRPVSGPDALVQSATAAVQSWKFEPYLSSGQAVEVETTIAVEFRLN
jgi:TonB family protein